MAAARKRFQPQSPTPTNEHLYATFIRALLAGSIAATKLIEQRRGNSQVLDLDYDDPNG